MSEHAVIVCELSTTRAEAPERARSVKHWLLERGIIEPNAATHELLQPSEFRAGARAIRVAPESAMEVWCNLVNNGVDIVCARTLHHSVENYEPPPCATCGAARVDRPLAESVEAWLEGEEPVALCNACGKSHPLGDWVSEFSWYVAEIAVSFNNWPEIDRRFLEELGNLLGPRWRIVYQHT
jgi:hypothetical protein